MDPAPQPSQDPVPSTAGKVALAQSLGCVGCGLIILISFAFLAYTYVRATRIFIHDPLAVEANLKEIVSCSVPQGYHGFLGANDEGKLRIALLAPKTYEGTQIDVKLPLVISAWSFPSERSVGARREEVVKYWHGVAQKSAGELKEVGAEESLVLVVRKKQRGATVQRLVFEEATLRLIVVLVPRAPGSDEQIALSFVGEGESFDQAAMDAFLASIE